MIRLKTALPLATAALLLSACTTPTRDVPPPATAAPQAAAPAPQAGPKNLRKGMTEADIRAVWGEPKATQPGKQAGESILIYQFDVLTTQKMVAAAMAEIPAVDPITGEPRIVMEPVMKPQQVTVTQTIVLQLLDGRLVSWARQLGEQRSFN